MLASSLELGEMERGILVKKLLRDEGK